jgi:hypothetical protein
MTIAPQADAVEAHLVEVDGSREFRCGNPAGRKGDGKIACRHLLMRGTVGPGTAIEIRCSNCNQKNRLGYLAVVRCPRCGSTYNFGAQHALEPQHTASPNAERGSKQTNQEN